VSVAEVMTSGGGGSAYCNRRTKLKGRCTFVTKFRIRLEGEFPYRPLAH
jgi:hypothetical protein